MKIVEALKKLRVIEKKMTDNAARIQKYSSLVSIEKPAFETEEIQKKEVKAYIQSNTDLMREYLDLKTKIENTNLTVKVKMNDVEYSLNDLLVLKRKLIETMLITYRALNDIEASTRIRSSREGVQPHIIRLYDEKEKNKNLDFWQDLRDNIDSRLEVVNANTNLI